MSDNSFLPRRLRLAREARGFTTTGLAEAIGISRQTASSWENGEYAPKPEILQRIATLLDFPVRFFFRPCPSPNAGAPYFRKLSAVTARGRTQASAKLDLLAEFAEYLAEEVEFPKSNLPDFDIGKDPGSVSEDDIEHIAAKTRLFFCLGKGPISNITQLLENNGVLISRFQMTTEGLDAFLRWINGIPYVLNNSSRASGVCRTRFNLAHELGHLIMHRSITPNQRTLGIIESQANRFASAFLMPAETYISDFSYPSLDVFLSLKQKWLSSVASQIVRCRDLDIILDNVYSRLFANLNRRGWRTIEPLDGELPQEIPKLLEKAILVLEKEGLFSRHDLLSNYVLPSQDVVDFAGLPFDFFDEQRIESTPVVKKRTKILSFAKGA